MSLSNVSIIAWLLDNGMKNEKGEPMTFDNHMFLYDLYRDMSPQQVIMKPAQIGASTMMNFKPLWIADKYTMDIIYTLPTFDDVTSFVGGKTNRLIAQNPILQELTADKDTIEQKSVGNSMIYWRGTFNKKAAMMIPADLLIQDEVDASNQETLEDYETRLGNSKYRWRWLFSHPSTEGVGVHKYWVLSDQKEWFITCDSCKFEQYMSWPESVDMKTKQYICKKCQAVISNNARRNGRWIARYKDREWSGYHISSLMCPWWSAADVIKKYETKDAEYFYTKVLGLPYISSDSKVDRVTLMQNVREGKPVLNNRRIIIGVDTGIVSHYVVGCASGVLEYGSCTGYEKIEDLFKRYPLSIAVFDQGGDLVAPRKLREKYPGRVYLCHYRRDRKTMQLITWGEGEEDGNVTVDRNRLISVLIGELLDKRITLWGDERKYEEMLVHFKNIYRVKEENKATHIPEYRWERSGPDHLVHAFCYMRVGLERYSDATGKIFDDSFIASVKEAPMLVPGVQTNRSSAFIYPDVLE